MLEEICNNPKLNFSDHEQMSSEVTNPCKNEDDPAYLIYREETVRIDSIYRAYNYNYDMAYKYCVRFCGGPYYDSGAINKSFEICLDNKIPTYPTEPYPEYESTFIWDTSNPCFRGYHDMYPYENMIDCSYSTNAKEACFIPDAKKDQWYILLITNFSRAEGNISFTYFMG